MGLVLLGSLLAAGASDVPVVASAVDQLGATNVLVSHGSGELVLNIPQDFRVATANFVDSQVYLGFVLSGPAQQSFMHLSGPDIDFPPVYGEGIWERPAGVYRAYVLAPPGVAATLRLELAGVSGEVELTMNPWEGEAGRMAGVLDAAGTEGLPGAPADLFRGATTLSQRGLIWTVEEIRWVGVGGVMSASTLHKVEQEPLVNDCSASLALGTGIGPSNALRTVFGKVYNVDSGPWQVGVDSVTPSSYVPAFHGAFYLAHPLLPGDPLRDLSNRFWQFVYSIPPIDTLPPEAQGLIHDVTCTTVGLPAN